MPFLEGIKYPCLVSVTFDMYEKNLRKAFEDKYNLTYLEISQDVFRSCAYVKILTLFKECFPLIKEASTSVKSVNKLQGIEKIYFNLSKTEDSENSVVFLKNVLQNLKILHLISVSVDTILDMLPSCCAKLEELFIINSSISEKGLISLCQKENNGDEKPLNLRVIDLSGTTQINDGHASATCSPPVGAKDDRAIVYKTPEHDFRPKIRRNCLPLSLQHMTSSKDWKELPPLIPTVQDSSG
ncbi:hypothetical protein TNCV_4345361 [Trichonephila clavipes]|nr:hypothetical protein TNCV_4345361 [Trichonephila clavipes]